jgi:hypothetical protein
MPKTPQCLGFQPPQGNFFLSLFLSSEFFNFIMLVKKNSSFFFEISANILLILIKLLFGRQTFVCCISIRTYSYAIWSIINDAQVPQLPTSSGLIVLLIKFFLSIELSAWMLVLEIVFVRSSEQTKTNAKMNVDAITLLNCSTE